MTDSIFAWDTTASDNDDADSTINWSEGQNPDTVNNSARAMMKRVADWISDVYLIKTTAGTGAAYTVTSTQDPASLPNGFTLYLLPHATNTGTCTITVSGPTAGSYGAKALRLVSGSNATAGDIVINKPIRVTYYTSGDEFLVDASNVTGISGYLQDVVNDTTPQLGGQLDVNGQAFGDGTNELLTFTEDASAVNHVNIENEATGSGPIISAAGDDTNIDLNLAGKGSGVVKTGGSEIVSLAATQTLTNKTLTSPSVGSSAFLTEQSAAGADVAGSGQLWVKDNTPCDLYFTDDAGTDVRITENGALASSGGAGAWEYISTVTASNDSTVAFTGLSSSYKAYRVALIAVVPSSDNVDFYLRTSTNNAHRTTAADRPMSGSFIVIARAGNGQQGGSGSQIEIAQEVGSASNEQIQGHVDIFDPSDTTYTYADFRVVGEREDGDLYSWEGAGYRGSAADVDAIQFLFSSGNIESGDFILYGLSAS